MKRNKLFLLGLFVVFAAVLSLSLVSSTFARYITTNNGSDTARVAKWGVTIDAEGDSTNVLDTLDSNPEVEIVSSSAGLLAPGTKGTFVTVNVEGTPEVAVALTYAAQVTLSGKWEDSNGNFYCPIVFIVNGNEIKQDATNDSASKLETAVENAINALTENFDAAEDLTAKDLSLTWYWLIDGGDNAADTNLGDLLANADATDDPTVSVSVDCTATQID